MFKPSNLTAKLMTGLMLTGVAVFFFLSRATESELSAAKLNPHPPEALAAAQAVLSTPGPEIKRFLESLPSASAPALVASNPVRKGLLGLNAGQLYQQALEAKNIEDRSLAFAVSLDCARVATIRPLTLNSLFKETEGKNVVEGSAAVVYDGWIASSRKELEAFCSTGNWSGFIERMRDVRLATGQVVQGPVWSGVLRSDKVNSPERQEFFQAMTQVLSSPDKYAAHFDRWTESTSFTRLTKFFGASYGETGFVADSLFERFGVRDMVQYRQIRRCSFEAMCFTLDMLPQAKRNRIETVADQIEQLIRTQRWDVLLAPRD